MQKQSVIFLLLFSLSSSLFTISLPAISRDINKWVKNLDEWMRNEHPFIIRENAMIEMYCVQSNVSKKLFLTSLGMISTGSYATYQYHLSNEIAKQRNQNNADIQRAEQIKGHVGTLTVSLLGMYYGYKIGKCIYDYYYNFRPHHMVKPCCGQMTGFECGC